MLAYLTKNLVDVRHAELSTTHVPAVPRMTTMALIISVFLLQLPSTRHCYGVQGLALRHCDEL